MTAHHLTRGPLQKFAVNWLDDCWLVFNTTTGEHSVSYNAAMVAFRSVRRRNKRRALELGYRLQDGRVKVDPYHAALGENIPHGQPGSGG